MGAALALASVLFVRRVMELTEIRTVEPREEKERQQQKRLVLDLKDMDLMDATAISNLEDIANHLARWDTALYLIRIRPALVNKMRRHGLLGNSSPIRFAKGYETVLQNLRSVPAPAK